MFLKQDEERDRENKIGEAVIISSQALQILFLKQDEERDRENKIGEVVGHRRHHNFLSSFIDLVFKTRRRKRQGNLSFFEKDGKSAKPL